MSKTFCPLPFNHLYIRPNGEYQPCCRFRNGQSKTRIHEYNSLDDVLNSSEMLNDIRQKMLSGKKVSGCLSCYLEEESGGESMRTGEISRWGDFDELADKTPQVTNIEITFGNYCNLACRTCGSSLSTSWQKDDEVLRPFYPERYVAERENVKKDWIPEDFKNIKKFKITGGEPMLHPDFPSFLDDIIQSGSAQNIEVQIFTNTSFVPKRHLLDRLSRFKNMGIWLSIDGIEQSQEYIRHNSKWDIVEAATRRWFEFENEYKDNVRINFAPTISIYNAHIMIEMYEWFKSLRTEVLDVTTTQTNCTWNITTYPMYLDIKHLRNKQELIDKYTAYKDTITEPYMDAFKIMFERAIERLEDTGQTRNLLEFVRYNKDVDKLRNQNFLLTFPELFDNIKDIWESVDGKLN